MASRRRSAVPLLAVLLAVLLALALLVAGALGLLQSGASVAGGDAPTSVERVSPDAPAAREPVPADDEERARRHVASDDSPSDAADAALAEARRQAIESPVRISSHEAPESTDGGVLRVRVIDELGLPRDDVHLNVVAPQGAGTATVHSGPVPATGLMLESVAGSVALRATAGSLTRITTVGVGSRAQVDVDLVVPRGTTVSGVVRHVDQGPLADVDLTIAPEERRPWLGKGEIIDEIRAKSAAFGAFELSNLPPGTHVVTFEGGPFGHVRLPRATLTVDWEPALRRDFVLGRPSLTGIVTDALSHLAIVGAEVVVTSPQFAMTRTDDEGRFAFTDLLAGAQEVRVTSSGHVPVKITTEPVAEDAPRHLVLEMLPRVSVVLRLLDEEGAPFTGKVGIGLRAPGADASQAKWRHLTAGAEGHIELGGLEPGSHAAHIVAVGCTPCDTTLWAGGTDSVVDVEVRRLPEEEIPVVVQGTVTDARSGAALAGARVLTVSEPVAPATAGPDGRYVMRSVSEHPDTVVVELDGYGSQFGDVPEDGELSFSLRRAGDLPLRVLDSEGTPYAGPVEILVLEMEQDGTEVGGTTTTDPSGRTTWRRLVPGRYRLELWTDAGDGTVEVHVAVGGSEVEVRLR